MKIVVFEAEPREAPVFEALRDQHEPILVESPLRGENVARHADADVVSTFIYSELDSGVIEKLPSLKLIATRSTCFDHIDTDYCTAPSTRERPPPASSRRRSRTSVPISPVPRGERCRRPPARRLGTRVRR